MQGFGSCNGWSMPCLKTQGRKVWPKFHNEGKNGKENIAQIFLILFNLSSKDSIISHTFDSKCLSLYLVIFVHAKCDCCDCCVVVRNPPVKNIHCKLLKANMY